jgi:hypothetical protein
MLGIVCFVLISAVSDAREAARQSACHGQMFYIYHALLNYHSEKGHFPPAYIEGPDGTPWHSWRTLLLPYLERHEAFEQYDFDEPWNGPNNSKLADKIGFHVYQCPSGQDSGSTLMTNYCVVIGEDTAFPGARTVSLDDPVKTNSQSIILVEVTNSDIHWMEPRDLAIDELKPKQGPRFGSPHPRGVGVVRANRTYEPVIEETPISSIKEQLQFSQD